MKKLLIGCLVLMPTIVFAAVPDMEAIREALSVDVMNSQKILSHKPIYRNLITAMNNGDITNREECVELMVKAVLNTIDPFILSKKDDVHRKQLCVDDRRRLFFDLLASVKELRNDRELNFKIAKRLGEIQPLPHVEGVSIRELDEFNYRILSFRSYMIFVFAGHHFAIKAALAPQEFEAFANRFLDTACVNEYERSYYGNRVFGSNYKPTTTK